MFQDTMYGKLCLISNNLMGEHIPGRPLASPRRRRPLGSVSTPSPVPTRCPTEGPPFARASSHPVRSQGAKQQINGVVGGSQTLLHSRGPIDMEEVYYPSSWAGALHETSTKTFQEIATVLKRETQGWCVLTLFTFYTAGGVVRFAAPTGNNYSRSSCGCRVLPAICLPHCPMPE